MQIEVIERAPPAIPDIIEEALALVRGGERPDSLVGNLHNDIFDGPKEQVRCAREVATGMFYRAIFPRREPANVIERWYEVRSQYNAEARRQILKGERFLDSPKLCADAARRYHGEIAPVPGLPEWRSEHWKEWCEVRDPVRPQKAAARLHDYLVRDAIRSPRTGSVLASMNSHGRGRDGLQAKYADQLVLNVPSSGRRNQQLYARLHRRGQKADTVRSFIYVHTDELREAHEQAIRRSDYAETLFKQRQKLTMGLSERRVA